MLLPSGRWNGHCRVVVNYQLVDVIIRWQMEVHGWSYFNFSSEVLSRISSHMLEASRTFGERFKEYLKAHFPIYDHFDITGHNVSMENFSIVEREDQNLCRWTKEALFIRVNNPSLNKNIGKYHLPHIWDEVLLNTSEIKLK